MTAVRAWWLVPLFVVIGVLAPTGCVLWFMNAAAASQRESARQSVTEAYRGQLRLLRDRADAFWLDRAATLDSKAIGSGPVAFQRVVQQGLADSVLLARYPSRVLESPSISLAGPPNEFLIAFSLEQTPGRLAAAIAAYARIAQNESNLPIAVRAAQGQIRCLARSGNKEGALRAIERYFVNGRFSRQSEPGHRSIGADELLLGLRLLKPTDPRYSAAAQRLATELNDYTLEIPATQRLFLMDELASSLPSAPALPTREAERLALRFLDADTLTSGDRVLQQTRLPGIWKLSSTSGRVMALYRTATVQAALQSVFEGRSPSPSVKFSALPPGSSNPDSMVAGAAMPGWQLSFTLLDSRLLEHAAQARVAAYLWIGYVMIACLAITGALVGQWLRREARLSRLKTDLVAAVSHELRTPLASMRLLLETLLDDESPDPRKVREYLVLMSGENLRLSRLIENFLAFSRIERNRQQFAFAPTPVADVIKKAITAMGDRLQPPACDLELRLHERVAPISADEDALVAVMVNLLDNACKYSPGAKKIAVSASNEDGRVVLSVQDNGIGIAPCEQRRIFRRFYQVDQRLARETGGCGLGLSIVDFVVRAHGGKVRVDSSPGSGSTFSVILPSAASPGAA